MVSVILRCLDLVIVLNGVENVRKLEGDEICNSLDIGMFPTKRKYKQDQLYNSISYKLLKFRQLRNKGRWLMLDVRWGLVN